MRGFGDSDEPTEITAYFTIKLREDIANLVKALSKYNYFVYFQIFRNKPLDFNGRAGRNFKKSGEQVKNSRISIQVQSLWIT